MSSLIDRVHAEELARFVWTADRDTYGVPEFWESPEPGPDGIVRGDCEDFALRCWHRLRAEGLHPRMALCLTETAAVGAAGYDHAVCLWEEPGTGRVLALDCRFGRVMDIRELPYRCDRWAWQVAGIADDWQTFSVVRS